MTFKRSLVIPFVLLAIGAASAACGDDDDDGVTTPTPDGGVETGPGIEAGPGNDAATTAPKITTAAALPAIVAGAVAAPVQLAATGSTPITWSLTGSAPPGMKVDPATGAYTGTPTASGAFSFTITATNAAGFDTVTFTQTVTAPAFDANVLTADNKLSSVSTAFPAGASTPAALTGVITGDVLVSIDRRPLNGYLYGLGFNATAGTVQVYTITPSANLATPVGGPVTYSDAATSGDVIGMDFNPTVDRIRVVTSSGQNFRLNPNTGGAAVADTRDGALNIATVATTGIAETAYTNNALNQTFTTQYSVSSTGSLYIQNPPNNGTLTVPVVIAPAITNLFGFDIAPGINVTASNAVAAGVGYGVVKTAAATTESLATINLATGALGVLGTLPFTGTKGFTLQKPLATSVIGLTAAGEIVRFLDNAPATVVTTTAITGVTAGEELVGLEFRPVTGQLYALGVETTAGVTGTLYRIDPQGATATVIGTAGGIALAGGAPGTTYGIDFNPTVDRLRVVSSTGGNYRINPNDGTLAATDTSITGGATALDGVAYTNGPPAMGATGVTAEYGINATTNSLHLFSNPNGGVVGTAIPVTLNGAALDFTAVSGFDIPPTVTTAAANTAPAAGSAYAALNVGGASNLYRINLLTGVATFVGSIGAGTAGIVGLAVGQ